MPTSSANVASSAAPASGHTSASLSTSFDIQVTDANGIIIADVDSESDTADDDEDVNGENVNGSMVPPDQADERAKKALREQLRNTLMSRSLTTGEFCWDPRLRKRSILIYVGQVHHVQVLRGHGRDRIALMTSWSIHQVNIARMIV
jgi:hypothetical protein